MRAKTAGRRQTIGEQIYEIAQTQVAEQGLPSKAIGRWFPYVRDADALHLGREHHRLHPAAADGRDDGTASRPGGSTRRRRRSR